jgi:hypothetical protein
VLDITNSPTFITVLTIKRQLNFLTTVKTELCGEVLIREVKLKVKQSRYTSWRRLGGGLQDVQLLLILDLGNRWGEWSASRPGRT